jgi:putative ABC transport system ATP-binding protein
VTPPIFEATGLTRSYLRGESQVRALDEVTLAIGAREYVAVAGPSGCGKTTLLHVLGLLDPGFGGELRFRGAATAGLGAARRAALRLEGIGFVFQAFHLLPTLDVRDNVALPHWRLHGSRRAARARAEELLAQMRLEHRARHAPFRLSGGEMQRAAIARALVNDPPVLLADEPTGNLDAKSMRTVLEIFANLWVAGRTLVVISHDPEVVSRARRVLVMRWGRIVTDVPVERIHEPEYNPWLTMSVSGRPAPVER